MNCELCDDLTLEELNTFFEENKHIIKNIDIMNIDFQKRARYEREQKERSDNYV